MLKAPKVDQTKANLALFKQLFRMRAKAQSYWYFTAVNFIKAFNKMKALYAFAYKLLGT